MRLTIGTRGSPLALTQTNLVLNILRERHPSVEFVVKVVHTTGDLAPNTPLRQLPRGLFAKELEFALAAGEIDLAVHSFKDLPTEIAPEFSIAATGKREDPRDVLVTPDRRTLAQLAPKSRLGTSSPRRFAQVRAFRPDIEVLPVRGNVGTRIRKAQQGELDGVVLAAAGMVRLGLQGQIAEYLDPALCLPAVGQGVLAVEVRAGDLGTAGIVQAVDHPETHVAVAAELAVLRRLGGGCRTPIAAYAVIEAERGGEGGEIHIMGMVASYDGVRMVKTSLRATANRPEAAGELLAQRLLEMGAGPLLQEDEP